MRVLVTGGAGYVGSVLVQGLLDYGQKVRVLDNLRFGGAGLLACAGDERFEFIRGDIRDRETVRSAVANADAIIHLASLVGFPACKAEPGLARETMVEGTVNLLACRNKDQKILFASTGSVYGAVENGFCTEESPVGPLSLYGEVKLEAEQLIRASGNFVTYRFATAFGASPRMRLDLLPNDFTYQAVHNKAIVIYEADFKRTFIHVQDMCESFIHALSYWDLMRDETYNVGHESLNLSKRDLAEKIRDYVSYYIHYADVGTDVDQRNYEVSYEKIRATGFETAITLDDGIVELIKAVRLIKKQDAFSNV